MDGLWTADEAPIEMRVRHRAVGSEKMSGKVATRWLSSLLGGNRVTWFVSSHTTFIAGMLIVRRNCLSIAKTADAPSDTAVWTRLKPHRNQWFCRLPFYTSHGMLIDDTHLII